MDQKLLDALSNMAEALEQIAEALNDKGKSGGSVATSEALKGGDFVKQIKEINIGVKQLQVDSKKILKNQETIIALSKKSSNDKKTPFEEAGGNKKKESEMKKGIGTILLIAIAVLAIGMAFKLIGGINFFSVIGLSLAILILSYAFEKVAKLNMSLKQAAFASATMVMMALAVTVSSWILKKITPISFVQSLTMILIGVGFSMLSPAIGKIINAFGSMSWNQVIKASIGLIVVLPAIALGMTISSWIMKKITPITFSQGITAILIAAVFTVISFGLKKMLKAFGGAGIFALGKAILFLPLVLPAIALGIVLSSYVLGKTQKVGLSEAWSAIMIALIFTVISFGLKKIINAMEAVDDPAKMILIPLLLPAVAVAIWLSSMALNKVQMMTFGQFLVSLGISILFIVFAVALKIMSPIIKKLKWEDVIKLPLLMTTMAIAVWASSHILKKTADISFALMLKILVFSVVFAIAVIVLAAVAWVIAKFFGVKNVLKGAVAIVALAATVMTSSWLIAKGNYSKYPSWKWSLFSGLAIAAFGIIGWVLMKIGSVSTYIKGGIAILAVAGTVMLASHILSAGNYSKYPKLSWAIGVAASLAAFGVAAALLGPMVFGPQALVFLAGAAAVLGVAATIMAASHILAKGNYSKYPSLGWSMSVALSLGAFTAGMVLLGGMIIASFGLGAAALAAGSRAVLGVAKTIVKASFILAKGKWLKGPTKEWASGVAIALGAFAPVYKMLMNNAPGLFSKGGGLGPEDFSKGIVAVTRGIITAANELASPKNKGVWKKGPTKEWAIGVGIALGAFAPVYKMMLANAGAKFFGSGGIGPEDFSKAILTVTRGIITAAKEFAKNTAPFKEGMYPSKQWGEGVGAALQAFAPVFKALSEDTGIFTGGAEVISNMVNGVLSIASAIVGVARIMSDPTVKWDAYPDSKWSKGLSALFTGMKPVFSMISEMDGILTSFDDIMDGMVRVGSVMVALSKKFANSNTWKTPPLEWSKIVAQNVIRYVDLSNYITNKLDFFAGTAIKDVVVEMALTARIIKSNDKYFSFFIPASFIKNITNNLKSYAHLGLYLLGKTKGFGNVVHASEYLVKVAKIISSGTKYMRESVNPNFMKSIASNLFYYMAIANKLQEQRGGIGGMIKDALMGDPIVQMAKGMILLAKAYDRLASSLAKMGKAMNNLNDKKISQLERISRIRPSKDLISTASAVSNLSTMPNVPPSMPYVQPSPSKTNQEKKNDIFPKGKYGNIAKQQDMIIDLLQLLNEKLSIGSNIDSATIKYLNDKASAKM